MATLQRLVLILLAGCLSACSGAAGLTIRDVPANGYDQTLNYEFQAQVYEDAQGKCKRMVVRVRPINKVYWKTPPPDRLQLYDDDCYSPIRFERIQYLAGGAGGIVRLSGPQVNLFWSEQFRLQDELLGWLWRQGIG
ncbi:MAG: hypothetical protein R2834_14075 [Rhodothermales bacterium]